MENKVYKFPSIRSFREVIYDVGYRARYAGDDDNGEATFNENAELPTLEYVGLVKSHGTNGGIVWVWNPQTFNYDIQVQSRERIITPLSDNDGFAAFLHTKNLDTILTKIMRAYGDDLGYTPETVRVYGEWCGGSIQKGVALNQLDKMFIIFAIKIDNKWLTRSEMKNIKMVEDAIYNIWDFPTYSMTIDFNNPTESANRMGELVTEVENECPIGKEFGVSGTGEGIVWYSITEGWTESRFWFKTKGDKHKVSSTKEKVPVDIERRNSMNELVDTFITEARLEQGIQHLNEMKHELSQKSTGIYLKWLVGDIIKEELDTILGNGFEVKEVQKSISNKGRDWYFNKLDEQAGL